MALRNIHVEIQCYLLHIKITEGQAFEVAHTILLVMPESHVRVPGFEFWLCSQF